MFVFLLTNTVPCAARVTPATGAPSTKCRVRHEHLFLRLIVSVQGAGSSGVVFLDGEADVLSGQGDQAAANGDSAPPDSTDASSPPEKGRLHGVPGAHARVRLSHVPADAAGEAADILLPGHVSCI